MLNQLLIILIIFTYQFLTAQVNTEKYQKGKEQLGLSGQIKLDLSLQTGNTDVQEVGLESFVDFRSKKSYTFLVLRGDLGWQNGDQFSNHALAHLRFIRTLHESLKLEIFTQFDYDKNRHLLHRELAGTGLRVKLFYGEKSKLNIGTAYIFEHEEYDFENDPSREKKANKHRWSNYLSYRLFLEDIIAFSSVLYVQPNFSDFRDYRILNENSFVVDISGKFSLGIEFNLRYDNKLPKDVKKLDTKTTVGLIYYF